MSKPKLHHINDTDPWMLAEDIPDIDVFFSQIWQSGFSNEFIRPNGRAYKKVLSIQRGYHLWFYFGKQDSFEVGEHIAQRMIDHPEWAALVNKKIITAADKLRRFADTITEEHLSRLSNKQLWQWYHQHDTEHTAYYQWCWIPVGADMFHDNLTNRLKQYLRTIAPENKINEYLVALTQPRSKSLIQIEQEDFLRLAGLIYRDAKQRQLFRDVYKSFQNKTDMPYGLKTHTPEYERLLGQKVQDSYARIKPAILKKIQTHYQRYYYVKFMWVGKSGVYSFDHYLKELVKLIGSGVHPIQELARIQRELFLQNKKRLALMQRLHIRPGWRRVFTAWGDFMVTKIYRRYAQIYAIYRMQPVLQEISKRLKVSLKEVRLMLKDEIRQGLLHSKLNRHTLKKRTALAVYYFEKTGKQSSSANRQSAWPLRLKKTPCKKPRN